MTHQGRRLPRCNSQPKVSALPHTHHILLRSGGGGGGAFCGRGSARRRWCRRIVLFLNARRSALAFPHFHRVFANKQAKSQEDGRTPAPTHATHPPTHRPTDRHPKNRGGEVLPFVLGSPVRGGWLGAVRRRACWEVAPDRGAARPQGARARVGGAASRCGGTCAWQAQRLFAARHAYCTVLHGVV